MAGLFERWYVAVPVVTLCAAVAVIGSVYLVVRFTGWHYPINRKEN